MDYLTEEQRQFDKLVQQIEEDAHLFKRPEQVFKKVLEFNNRSDSTILVNADNRIITFGNTNQSFTILDADYVIDQQEFNAGIEAFEQFYQKEKAAAQQFIDYLNSLELPVAPEIMPPEPEVLSVETIKSNPYGVTWLQNPDNANWELHWDNGLEKENEQYISQDLYHAHHGEFILHEYRAIDGYATTQRHFSDEAVKAFVYDKFHDPENILQGLSIEADLSLETSLPVSLQEQLLNRIESEYEAFKEGMKQNSKEDMMNPENTYETMVKTEIVHHVREGYISDGQVNVLLESENLIDDIYQDYTANDSNQFFDPIQAAINNHVTQYQGLDEEIKPTFKTPQIFDKATITPIAFIHPVINEGFSYMQYEFTIDDELREEWEMFGEEIHTSTYRIQYDEIRKEPVIMETASDDFYVSEDKSYLFDVEDVLAHCEELAKKGTLADYTAEFTDYLKSIDNEEIDLDSTYVEVQTDNGGYLSADELDADDIGNMKKHKARTNIKDFGYKGLE